jgi:UDP-glucose 4-epimerase
MHIDFNQALVTGGAGFIGSHLVEALLSGGCQVRVLDNISTGHLHNLAPVLDHITFYKNDIREPEALEEAAEGCDVIFHLAAVVAVQETISNPIESAMINDIGTINVLEAARAGNVRRVVLASSCAVYGDDPRLPKKETMTPRPASPYAVHKLSAEHYARVYFDLFGLETVSLRFFNVYGPRQDPSSPYSGVISKFMANAVSNQVPVIYGDGNQSRDFVYVKDVVMANLLAAGTDNLEGSVLNVGSGSDVLINRLWELIAGLGGQRLAPRYEPARNGDILHSLAGMELTQSVLNFKNDFTLEQGLKTTFGWYRDQMAEDG